MNTYLLLDVGNTRTKVGIADGNFNLVEVRTIQNNTLNSDSWFQKYKKCTSLVSSVKTSSIITDLISNNSNFQVLNHKLKLPFNSNYTTPNTLGSDRIAAIAGAIDLFPKTDCLVVDAGTCITYDWVTRKNIHLGGNISPGLQMRLQSMHQFTSQLPLVDLKKEKIKNHIGTSTYEAIANGSVFGIINEIKSYLNPLAKTDKLKLILTGGDAQYLAEYLEKPTFVEPNLVLKGLCKIMELNAKT